MGGVPDEGRATLLEEILAHPGVPRRWRRPDLALPLLRVLGADHRHARPVDWWRLRIES